MSLNDDVKLLEKKVEELERKKIYQQDLTPDAVKQEHVLDMVIKRGLATNRPTEGEATPAYFATDTGVLSVWDGSSWLTTTLS